MYAFGDCDTMAPHTCGLDFPSLFFFFFYIFPWKPMMRQSKMKCEMVLKDEPPRPESPQLLAKNWAMVTSLEELSGALEDRTLWKSLIHRVARSWNWLSRSQNKSKLDLVLQLDQCASFISFDLEQFFHLSLSFMTLTFLKSTSQLTCRMSVWIWRFLVIYVFLAGKAIKCHYVPLSTSYHKARDADLSH